MLRLLTRFRKRVIMVSDEFYLCLPQEGHLEQWIELRRESRAFLQPWEPKWPTDDLTPTGFKRRLRTYHKNRNAGWGKTYFLMRHAGDQLIGGLSLTHIEYGNARCATLGYWMGERYSGYGHMQLAVRVLVDYAFEKMKLLRVEAACVPDNARSIHLLKKCGFRETGFAKDYLEINGTLRDHILMECRYSG